MLKRFKLLQGSIDVSWREAIISVKEISPSSLPIVFGSFFYLDDSRAAACGGFQLLVYQLIMMPVEIGRGICGGARTSRVLHGEAPSFGGIEFYKF